MSARLRAPIEAVTFDLDHTLWELEGVIEHAERRAYAFLDRHFPAVTAALSLEDVLALRGRTADDRPDLVHNVTALRHEVFRRAGRAGGYEGESLEGLVERTFAEFLDARHEVVLFDDTIPVLDWLREQGLRVGAITNGNAEVHRLGLDGYFDFALSAMEVGAAKPSHLVFEAARGRAGVPMGHIVHVGDEPSTDVIGAATAGMQPVWFNRHGASWPADEVPRTPCVELASLTELRDQLAEVLG
ncbi:MAG: HAD-IA family hydrolase [Arhodomonas sp.]|nr:HAD-IA family hydrolase [Arhodomonas sp.]